MRITPPNQARRRNRRAAFTLMEILVVVAIMVVLAGVGIVSYMRIQEDANRSAAKLKVEEIEKAAQAYMRAPGRNNTPPMSLQELATPDGGQTQAYIKVNDMVDPWGNQFMFKPLLDAQSMAAEGLDVPFLIYSMGPNKMDNGGAPGTDDITNR